MLYNPVSFNECIMSFVYRHITIQNSLITECFHCCKNSPCLTSSFLPHCNLFAIVTSKITDHKSPSVQFSCSVMSDSLPPYELQHTRLPCPSPTAGVYTNPCPLSQWCQPTISSSVIPFSSCPQSFLASGSIQMLKLPHNCTHLTR